MAIALAQTGAGRAAAPDTALPQDAATAAPPSVVQQVVPAGTLVALRVDENLSSQTSHRGDTFTITLMNDLRAGNRIVLPMGTKGVGEVIHAAARGFGGRAGELIVTARYLEWDGKHVPLRGFKLAVAGSENVTAALVASALVPIAGMFVTGSSARIGLGQLAQAKLAEPFPFPETSGNAQHNALLNNESGDDQK